MVTEAGYFTRRIARAGCAHIARGLTLGLALFTQPAAQGGGAGENVIVVVNNQSWASKAVANAYVELREIPPSNVVYLDEVPSFERMEMDPFREKVLRPIGRHIDTKGLSRQIDYIVYSADMPTNIGLSLDIKKAGRKLPKIITPEGSINGLTYLYPYVLTTNLNYLAMNVNVYVRNPLPGFQKPREKESFKAYLERLDENGANVSGIAVGNSRGFRGRYAWDNKGNPQPKAGPRYMLSTVLAVTSGDGQSLDDAIATLRRGASADGTRPKGTFYYMMNGDIRTKTRQWGYFAAIEQLRRLGHRAELVDGTLPLRRKDVIGLTMGSPRVDWKKSGCRAVPGAIIDNLTSYGGTLFAARGRGQTPISEFLRGGGTAACGTVTEPYALQPKFPLPFLHLHYVKGCTMAESFYQSVSAPYQLLIIGDPLCAPWVEPPAFTVKHLEPGGVMSGMTVLTPRQAEGSPRAIKHYETFIDGTLRWVCKADGEIKLDTELFIDGYHEVTVLASSDDALESTGRVRMAVQFDNFGLPAIQVEARPETRLGETVELRARMTGAERIRLYHNDRLLGIVEGPEGELVLPASAFGMGPVRVFAVGEVVVGSRSRHRRSSPALFRITEPDGALAPMPPRRRTVLVPGLRLEGDGIAPQTVRRLDSRYIIKELTATGAVARVTGYVKATEAGLHHLQVRSTAPVTVKLDGTTLTSNDRGTWDYLPLILEKGTHFLQAEVVSQGTAPRLDIRFGREGTAWVDYNAWVSEAP